MQSKITNANSEDVIDLPSCACGTVTWTSPVAIEKSVVIRGQGAGATCITGIGFVTVAGIHNWRVTGMKFTGTTGTVVEVTSGTEWGGTPITGWRIDNNIFDGYADGVINVYNGSTGLLDNNLFTNTGGTDAVINIKGRDSQDWATPSSLGSENQQVFIEDNRFETSSSANHVVQGAMGSSYVFRCNDVGYVGTGTYKDIVDAHGYGHGTWRRGTRAYEVYGNLLENDNYDYRTIDIRSGTGRIFANRWTNENTFIELKDYRMISTGEAPSMAYPTDPNDCTTGSSTCPGASEATCCADHEGYACCDQIGRGQDAVNGRQSSDPLYIWDNRSVSGANIPVVTNDGGTGFIQLGRDYFDGVVPLGYLPFTYPYPARDLPPTTTCLTDANSRAQTGITFVETRTKTAGGCGYAMREVPGAGDPTMLALLSLTIVLRRRKRRCSRPSCGGEPFVST